MKFAYWATNLGELVFSAVPQRADTDFAFQAAVARQAEAAGFDYALMAARFQSVTDGTPDLEDALATTAALASITTRLKLIAAVHPGLWHPAMIAKFGATVAGLSGGRFAVNVVSGWFKEEFLRLGEFWLDHDERYRRSSEFITVLRGLWTGERFSHLGDFYRLRDVAFRPAPLDTLAPEIFQGGNSTAARAMAARHADWYLMNGDSVEGAARQIAEIRALAAPLGRTPRFGINAQVVLGETETEALYTFERIIAAANVDVVESFGRHARGAGQSTADRIGMWADSDFANRVQPNDGFKTRLIGTPQQVRARIQEYKKVGVDLILAGFLDYEHDLARFGHDVIAPLRADPVPRLHAAG
jgi:FMNH2-dependent dimethyl sulfone monooxygenase